MSNQDVGITLAPITQTGSTVSPATIDDAVVIIRTVTLIVLLVLSLIGNVCIVLAVAQTTPNRYIPFNAFLLSMASYGLLECALTMSLATGFSVEGFWKFGDFLAGFNASFVQLQNVGVVLTVVAMALDRYVAVTRLTTYHTHSSAHHANYIVLYTWIHAFIFSLPLLFQNQMLGITCRAFVERCLCGLTEGTSIAYTALLGIFCYFIPFVLVFVFICLVAHHARKERKRVKALNTIEYASYCMQESMVLNEARCCKYVGVLFFLYLIFKGPYVFVDFLTQLNFIPVFEPIFINNVTVTVDGTKFYYQTALSWMMFCFSAIFPVITFMQFPNHWRRLKNWATCGRVPASSSSSRQRNLLNRHALRQKQRRERHRQRRAEIARKRKLEANDPSLKKVPSSVSSGITSEKVAVNGAISGEMFRVPVLYPATDGLHLVASDKTLQTKNKKMSSGSVSSTNNNNNLSDNSLSTSKTTVKSSLNVSQPSSDVIGDVRPSSVVDKRVDVMGSRDGLRVDREEDVYIYSDFDPDEDTESELETSTNSRTLIWPNKQRQPGTIKSASMGDILNKTTKSIWSVSAASHRGNLEGSRVERRSYPMDAQYGDSFQDHPHTPTPPPDDEKSSSFTPNRSYVDNVHDFNFEQLNSRSHMTNSKLPSIKAMRISSALSKTAIASSREEPLLSKSDNGRLLGLTNNGYESPSALYSRRSSDASIIIKQTTTFSNNKVHPNQIKAFISDSNDYPVRAEHLGALSDSLSTFTYASSPGGFSPPSPRSPSPRRSASGRRILRVASTTEISPLPRTPKRTAPPIPDMSV